MPTFQCMIPLVCGMLLYSCDCTAISLSQSGGVAAVTRKILSSRRTPEDPPEAGDTAE